MVADENSMQDPRDGKIYKIVTMGTQIWMAENLAYNAEGSECYLYNEAYCGKYGRLYDWGMALEACPSGWHLPSNGEWEQLHRYAEDIPLPYTSYAAGKYLKAESGWNSNGNGENTQGFAALPGGRGYADGNGYFGSIGSDGYWWTSTPDSYSQNHATSQHITYDDDYATSERWGPLSMFSVRCVADSSVAVGSSSSVASSSSGVYEYKKKKIGEQVWMLENLNEYAEGSMCHSEKPANCELYGRLYDWETAMKICPSGWRLPSNEDWEQLFRYADGNSGDGIPYDSPTAGTYLKSASGWLKNGNGEDTHGFAALPGNICKKNETCGKLGVYGHWWTSSESDNGNPYHKRFNYANGWAMWHDDADKSWFMSVRCVEDE